MTNWKYVLDAAGQPVPESDPLTWGAWYEHADRTVALAIIGGVRVSTVFLGLDHSFGGPLPILWETMIFGGPHDRFQERYATRADAVAGHATAVALVRKGV